MSGDVDELIAELKQLTVPDAKPADHTYELPVVRTLDAVEFALGEYFDKHPAVGRVNLVIAGRPVGVVSRIDIERDAGRMAGDSPASQVGVGEGMQLPGFSTRYRLLEFTCPDYNPRCVNKRRIHYDVRDIPKCEHGRMELLPR